MRAGSCKLCEQFMVSRLTVKNSKESRQKAIEIEIAFFHSLGNPKGHTLDHFFYASHTRQNFPYKLIPILMS